MPRFGPLAPGHRWDILLRLRWGSPRPIRQGLNDALAHAPRAVWHLLVAPGRPGRDRRGRRSRAVSLRRFANDLPSRGKGRGRDDPDPLPARQLPQDRALASRRPRTSAPETTRQRAAKEAGSSIQTPGSTRLSWERVRQSQRRQGPRAPLPARAEWFHPAEARRRGTTRSAQEGRVGPDRPEKGPGQDGRQNPGRCR